MNSWIKASSFLDITDVVYNAHTSEFLGSKNVSLFRVTEEHYTEDGLFNGLENVTNEQTFENTYLSNNNITIGKGKGTIETTVGEKIDWIPNDLGILIDSQWHFYGVILFNNTQHEPLSFLNNSIGLYKSTPENPRTIWLWE